MEVVISLVLVGAALIYLFRDPFKALCSERTALNEIEFRRLWQSELMALEEKLPELCPALREREGNPKKEDLRTEAVFKEWPKEVPIAYYLFSRGRKDDRNFTYYKVKVAEKEYYGKGERDSEMADGSYEFVVKVPKG